MKKKAIFIANTGFNLHNYRLSGMKFLSSKGWSVIGVANDEANFSDKFAGEGIKFINMRFDDKGKNPIADILFLNKLIRLYRKESPHLVHHFSSKPVTYGSFAAKWTNVPSIVNTVAGLGYPLTKGGLLTFILKTLSKLALSGRPHVTFQNEDDLHYFVSNGIVKKSNTHLIQGSGVNTKAIRPVNSRKANGRRQFLLFSRMLWSKGIREFVEAAAKVKKTNQQATFLMAGGASIAGANANPEAIPMEWLMDVQRGGLVEWKGPLSFRKLMDVVDQSDVIVLPSYHPEGVPRSLIEAAAKGKPIITTNMPGCKDIVIDGSNGFIVPPKNAELLAEAMIKFIQQPGLIDTMGKASRKLAEDIFDESIFLEKTAEVYNRVGAL